MNYGYCFVSISPLRSDKSDASEIVSQLLFGELVELGELDYPWLSVRTFSDNYEGFVDHKHIRKLSEKEFKRWSNGLSFLQARERTLKTPWGVQRIPRGAYAPSGLKIFNIGPDNYEWQDDSDAELDSIVELAMDYINTPYLWGGKTPFGIDCSGIVQIIYRLHGFNLPRDASEQIMHGSEVPFNEVQAGDLAFFENSKGKITHVGILDGKGGIIHAAGHVRLDKFLPDGIFREDFDSITHKLTCIKRL